jgi:hypothetical protein
MNLKLLNLKCIIFLFPFLQTFSGCNNNQNKKLDLKILETVSSDSVTNEFPEDLSDTLAYNIVDIEPKFPGSNSSFRQFLESNLNYKIATENGAPEGTYVVVLMFRVNKNGIISDIHPITNHGYGMEVEAIKAIKKSPNWIPAIKNNYRVNAYQKLPITFRVETK